MTGVASHASRRPHAYLMRLSAPPTGCDRARQAPRKAQWPKAPVVNPLQPPPAGQCAGEPPGEAPSCRSLGLVSDRAGMDPVEALRLRGGVARRFQLVSSSREGRELDRRVRVGEIVRVAPGTYALPGVDPILIATCVHSAHATCVTAAALHGLTVLAHPERPHLSVPRSRGTAQSPVRQLWPAVVHREDGAERADPGLWPVASVADALARMLRCCPALAAIVTVDSALAQRKVTVSELAARLTGPSRVRAHLALRQVDGRSQSPTETIARLALIRAGLPVEPAVRIEGVGWVDLLVAGRVVVELDGFRYHSDRHQYREDRRRDRELVRLGYRVLRFTYEDVMRDPGLVVAAVLAALAAQAERDPV